tara:strand:- start:305 stop:1210 length:906 start_codon:yes stop_codon:yes gene_type:complete
MQPEGVGGRIIKYWIVGGTVLGRCVEMGMLSSRFQLKVALTGLLLLCNMCGKAHAQVEYEYGEYLTYDGRVVAWERISIYYQEKNGVVSFEKPQHTEVIEGTDAELVNSDGDLPGHPNTRFVFYDKLLRARDQLKGFYRMPVNGAIHVCDNPDCEFGYRGDAADGPYLRKVAGWSIGIYASYLNENPEDWAVMREFAIAAAIFNDLRIAMDVMYAAYLNDPGLAFEPIDMEVLGIRNRIQKSMRVKSVNQAYRDDNPASWLMVVVLMQSDGELERASEMLQKAIDAGLDEAVAEQMKEALE